MLALKKLLLIFAALALIFSGCSGENAVYDRNTTEHWINGKNGKKLNTEEHRLDENNFCSVCQSEIAFAFDGGAEINNFDEKGNQIRFTGYSKDGSVTYDYTTEYRYGENDEIVYSATYQDGRLYETYENIGGTIQEEYFEKDGSHTLSITYEGYLGDTIINQWYAYDPDGNIYYESCIESIIDDEGNSYILTETTANYQKGVKTFGEYDEKNNPVFRKEYDLDGNLLALYEFVFEYDKKGGLVYEKQLLDGKPSFEIFFDVVEEGDNFYSLEKKSITYAEDGSKTIYSLDEKGNIIFESHEEFFFTKDGEHYLTTVTEIYDITGIKQVTDFNSNGDELSCKSYNLGGELLSTYDYVYEYGEGNCAEYVKIFFNGKLSEEHFFNIVSSENGFESRISKRICYVEDGSYFVYEYDENESEIDAAHFDSNGNIIE